MATDRQGPQVPRRNAARPGPAWPAPRSPAPRWAFPRPRLRRNDDRGHQRGVGCPACDRVPAVHIQARDPQGTARRLNTGDNKAVALPDRPHVRGLLADPDPRRQLTGFAGITRGIMARTEPLYRILVSAAGSDPGAAALLEEQTRQRQQGQARIARSLARAGALRAGVRERDAADIIHALMSPEVYRLLTRDRGWRPERYQQWLQEILIGQLLPPPPVT